MASSVFGGEGGDVQGPASATTGNVATFDGTTGKLLKDGGAPAAGTVTTVSVTTANGVSGTVATATTTPALTLTLGAITPTTIAASGKTTTYNAIATTGWGVPAIYAAGRAVAQTGDVASVATYTVGGADGSFLVSCNVLVTAYTAGTQAVKVTYTDEGTNARTLVLTTSSIAGVLAATIGATGAFEGVPLHVRAKAGTTITFVTVGTAWTGTYNVDGVLIQTA